jgi:hypothetical protein
MASFIEFKDVQDYNGTNNPCIFQTFEHRKRKGDAVIVTG